MTTGMGSRRATPRPWQFPVGGDIAGPDGSSVIPGMCTTADAALIVEAVNAYDRLRAIEAGLRELVDHGPQWSPHPAIVDRVPQDREWAASLVAVADLRRLLDPATTEPKEPE